MTAGPWSGFTFRRFSIYFLVSRRFSVVIYFRRFYVISLVFRHFSALYLFIFVAYIYCEKPYFDIIE